MRCIRGEVQLPKFSNIYKLNKFIQWLTPDGEINLVNIFKHNTGVDLPAVHNVKKRVTISNWYDRDFLAGYYKAQTKPGKFPLEWFYYTEKEIIHTLDSLDSRLSERYVLDQQFNAVIDAVSASKDPWVAQNKTAIISTYTLIYKAYPTAKTYLKLAHPAVMRFLANAVFITDQNYLALSGRKVDWFTLHAFLEHLRWRVNWCLTYKGSHDKAIEDALVDSYFYSQYTDLSADVFSFLLDYQSH